MLKRLVLLAGMAVMLLGGSAVAAEPHKGGVITVATIGEPPTLDPMVSTADLVGMISQHIFETLYTFDAKWQVTPLLAESMPKITDGGKVYTIPLRKGVLFHDGETMNSADVVASLKRWEDIAVRGKLAAGNIQSIEAVDPATVRITLKAPFAPLLSLLAFNNSAAVIMPKAHMDNPLTQVIGTGPYKLAEHKPDQYIRLVRFDGYKPRAGAADGYGGARHAYLDEIRFVPVPNADTRVAGALSGQFDYADSLPVESYAKLKGQKTTEPVLLKPFGWPLMAMNIKQGILTNVDLRRAVLAALNPNDMLMAAFGSTQFYTVDGALYPKGYVWHTDAGTAAYGHPDPAKAKALLKKGGYDGKPLRILVSKQYDFHYKMALVAAAYLKAAGFKVDLQVVDWATLVQRRADPKLWDIFFTHSPFLPEPSLNGYMADDSPGWWATPAKDKAVEAFNTATDPAKRVALWADVQKLFYQEVPLIKIGDFNELSAMSPKLQGFKPAPWPYFWNVSLSK